MRIGSLRTGCACAFLVAGVLFGQSAGQPLAFEVASIKSVGPLDPIAIRQGKAHVGMKVDGAICDIGSFSLRDLIRTAYDVKDYQILGIDSIGSPLDAPRFNIQATLPAGATEKQVPEMLQTLLAERFKLAVRRETKEESVYALLVAKGGSKMKEAEPEPKPSGDAAASPSDTPKQGERVLGFGSNQVRVSGNMRDGTGITVNGGPMGQMHVSMVDGKIHMEAARMTMAGLADVATNFVGKPVVDMTDLKGEYQVAFDVSMDDVMNVARTAGLPMAGGARGGNLGAAGDGPVVASDPSGSAIFASMQQLGLKLESRKAPVSMIVVEHFEKTPTDN